MKQTPIPFTIEPGQEKQRICPLYELPGPGFYRVACTFESGSAARAVSDSMTVGYAPSKIEHALTREADFDEFWKKALEELQEIEP